MTWQEIINDTNANYLRNSPLSKQRATPMLQKVYKRLLHSHEWGGVTTPIKIDIATPVVEGEQFPLPREFVRIDEDSAFIVDNDIDNFVEIISEEEVAYFRDQQNRDEQTSYFTTLEDGGNNFLVFHFGEAPQNTIEFNGIVTAEDITDINAEPKYLPRRWHDLLVYALAREVLIGRNIDRTELVTFNEIKTLYRETLAQYAEENNEIELGA